MEQMNFHKQKLYSLIAAAVALISMLLTWMTVSLFIASKSFNGFHSWGWLSFIGIVGVGALSFMGNKQENYTAEHKNYILISFGAIALGAFLFFLRKNSIAAGGAEGAEFIKDLVKTGIGVWICIAAGLAGLALNYGLIKIEDKAPDKTLHTGTTTTITTTATDTTNTTV